MIITEKARQRVPFHSRAGGEMTWTLRLNKTTTTT